ncbi:histone-lysine N-methyltransferase SETD8-A [Elysia marginata]|uniref:Histone-lysine N-methyltransferase SETD8-A n=1 Tax=Elysia marginata TaxID=1093978 RepID=A0AAV4JJK9_9GAST|nr:histone-lysine N-methyltransferase SETD8-A [Elysia marginata]
MNDEFVKEILEKFREDETGKLCRTYFLLNQLGRKLWSKSARKERRVIMSDMRTLGNLILQLRKEAHDDSLEGRDILKRKNFENLTKAIQQMTHNEDTGILKPGLKLDVGFLLKKIVKVMKGRYIQENNLNEAEEQDRFSTLLDLNWKLIFYTAQLMCEERRQNLRKPGDMPLEKDITALRNFIVEETARLSDSFYEILLLRL